MRVGALARTGEALWRLDGNIVDSLRDWALCFQMLGCNPYLLVLVPTSMLVLLPGYLFFLPIYRTFVSPLPRDGAGSWTLLILFHTLALGFVFAPMWISSILVSRGHERIKEASGNALLDFLVWAFSLFLSWTLSQREIDKAAVLALSTAVGIAVGVWYFNQQAVAVLASN